MKNKFNKEKIEVYLKGYSLTTFVSPELLKMYVQINYTSSSSPFVDHGPLHQLFSNTVFLYKTSHVIITEIITIILYYKLHK